MTWPCRAVNQAWLFGASFTLGAADGLTCPTAQRTSCTPPTARSRPAPSSSPPASPGAASASRNWRPLVGAGFYGAAAAEARAMAGQDVYVIGRRQSAGQAAIHLPRYAASVTMVVRGAGLTASMSSYLVTEISKTANIRVRPSTEVTGGHGQCSLERLTLRERVSGAAETCPPPRCS